MRICSIFVFLLPLLLACRATQKAQQDSPDLSIAVKQLVNCLNAKDFKCVADLYTTDFKGWAPVVEYDSKEKLLAAIQKNYEANDWHIKAMIEEIHQEKQMGYVVLNWQILTIGEKEATLMFNKKHLQIWNYAPQTGWQLERSLFYDPNKPIF